MQQPFGHIPQRFLQRPRPVAKALCGLSAAELPVGAQHADGIRGEKQRLLFPQRLFLIEGCGQPGKPKGEIKGTAPQSRRLSYRFQQPPDGGIVPGKDIPLPRRPARSAGQDAVGDIPHVHKVIPAAHRQRQPPPQVVLCHGGKAAALQVARPDDTGGEHHRSIQPLPCRLKDKVRGLRLGFGIAALHQLGGKPAVLGDGLSLGLFRQRMHRADINQLFHPVRRTMRKHPGGAVHIDPPQDGGGAGGDGDNSGTMDHAAFRPGPLKEAVQRSVVGKITGNGLHLRGQQRQQGITGQHQSTHRSAGAGQLLQHGPPQKAGSAGHIITIKHKGTLLSQAPARPGRFSVFNVPWEPPFCK